MHRKSCLQIFCHADIGLFRIRLTSQDVNVVKRDGLPSVVSQRLKRKALLRGLNYSANYGGHPSPSATLRTKDGGGKEVRTPDLLNAIQASQPLIKPMF